MTFRLTRYVLLTAALLIAFLAAGCAKPASFGAEANGPTAVQEESSIVIYRTGNQSPEPETGRPDVCASPSVSTVAAGSSDAEAKLSASPTEKLLFIVGLSLMGLAVLSSLAYIVIGLIRSFQRPY